MQNTINYMKVPSLELSYELWNKIWPFAGKVFVANVTNSITQLVT